MNTKNNSKEEYFFEITIPLDESRSEYDSHLIKVYISNRNNKFFVKVHELNIVSSGGFHDYRNKSIAIDNEKLLNGICDIINASIDNGFPREYTINAILETYNQYISLYETQEEIDYHATEAVI